MLCPCGTLTIVTCHTVCTSTGNEMSCHNQGPVLKNRQHHNASEVWQIASSNDCDSMVFSCVYVDMCGWFCWYTCGLYHEHITYRMGYTSHLKFCILIPVYEF